jgi:hypothetical protein
LTSGDDMPQPFSSFGNKAFSFYANSAEQRPALAMKIVNVLSAWSHLETRVGWVFSRMLGAEEEKGIAIYNALSNLGAHTVEQVFDAVAAKALNQEQRDFAQAIRGMTKSVRDRRNPIAHGVWGISTDMPDALLLRSPRESLRATGNLLRRLEADFNSSKPLASMSKELAGDEIGEIFVYREKDFVALIDDIETINQAWRDLDAYVYGPSLLYAFDEKRVEQARRRLFGSGEVLARVNKIREGRKEPPLPPR